MGNNSHPKVSWRALFHGCVRESLAAAYSVARIGTQETRAWEMPLRYVADDNQGNVGIVEFSEGDALGAVNSREPRRAFELDRAILAAPPMLQDSLRRICKLPLLGEGVGPSVIFWTVGGWVELPEAESADSSWVSLFCRELLSDGDWIEEGGARYYGMSLEVSGLLIAIARRAEIEVPLVGLTEGELRILIPDDSEFASEARDLIFSDGLCSMRRF